MSNAIELTTVVPRNGKATITITTDSEVEAHIIHGVVMAVRSQLMKRGRPHGAPRPVTGSTAAEKEAEGLAPMCEVHNAPMTRQSGKYGPFWSCHVRMPDGRFCSYRPAAD